ncbi:MAG: PIN domain-containing protein [Gammaproteobacteria bacterium]|nr:PIN domain-containing protein [Gammaproteobacteria bacterium]
MIFDTDIFIWAQRGNKKAAGIIDTTDNRYLSVQSYMELLQGARNKKQIQYIKDFLFDFNFTMLPLTESIGHRAAMYIEKYSLSSGM